MVNLVEKEFVKYVGNLLKIGFMVLVLVVGGGGFSHGKNVYIWLR